MHEISYTLVRLNSLLVRPKYQSGVNFVCPTTRNDSVMCVCFFFFFALFLFCFVFCFVLGGYKPRNMGVLCVCLYSKKPPYNTEEQAGNLTKEINHTHFCDLNFCVMVLLIG